MRLRMALIGLLVAALPLAGPVPSQAKPKAPGRTIIVEVSGLPKRTKAKITVKGPKKYHKTVKTAGTKKLARLRPGKYRISAGKVTTGRGLTLTPKVHPRKGKVTTKKGLRVKITYSSAAEPEPGQDEITLPPEPFPGALSPTSIVLVSGSQSGVVGDHSSMWPSWAPDGGSVAFSSCATNLVTPGVNGCFVYTRRLDTGAVTRIPNTSLGTDLFMWGGETRWSPDGARIAFTTLTALIPAVDKDTNKDVYAVTLSDGSVARISQSQAGAGLSGGPYPALAEEPRWSPDGTRILFQTRATSLAAGDTDEAKDIYIKTLTTGAVTRISRGQDSAAGRWSPDGTQIAFTSGDSTSDVFTAPFGGGVAAAITSDHASEAATWAPGGDQVAFASGSALVYGDTNDSGDVFTRHLSSGTTTRISTGPNGQQTLWSSGNPVWSPDGSKVAFTASGADYGQVLLVKNLVNGAVTQVMKPQFYTVCNEYEENESGDMECIDTQMVAHEASDPVWSPDSSRLAFTASHSSLVPGDTNEAYDVFVATL